MKILIYTRCLLMLLLHLHHALAANIYNLGAVRHDRWLVVHVSRLFACELKKIFHKMQGRTVQVRPLLVLLAVTCGLNILLCIYYAVNATSNKSGASNYLLIMFMANMFVYLKYYMIMKFKSGERPVYQTWIYAGRIVNYSKDDEGLQYRVQYKT